MCMLYKQKTTYDMRISDWSSDVCSSDLAETAASMVADADKARTLWVHPDDAVLLADCPLMLAIESDPAMMRGTVRLETSTGWIEHGRAVYLDELRAALGTGEDRKSTRLNSSH